MKYILIFFVIGVVSSFWVFPLGYPQGLEVFGRISWILFFSFTGYMLDFKIEEIRLYEYIKSNLYFIKNKMRGLK